MFRLCRQAGQTRSAVNEQTISASLRGTVHRVNNRRRPKRSKTAIIHLLNKECLANYYLDDDMSYKFMESLNAQCPCSPFSKLISYGGEKRSERVAGERDSRSGGARRSAGELARGKGDGADGAAHICFEYFSFGRSERTGENECEPKHSTI